MQVCRYCWGEFQLAIQQGSMCGLTVPRSFFFKPARQVREKTLINKDPWIVAQLSLLNGWYSDTGWQCLDRSSFHGSSLGIGTEPKKETKKQRMKHWSSAEKTRRGDKWKYHNYRLTRLGAPGSIAKLRQAFWLFWAFGPSNWWDQLKYLGRVGFCTCHIRRSFVVCVWCTSCV